MSAGPAVHVPLPSRAVARRSWRWWLPFWFAGFVGVVALFAPLIANDVPLVARVDGVWSFPAFADLIGPPPAGPRDLSWKVWWSRLDDDSPDFAVMPPWPYGPDATDAQRFAEGPSIAHPLGSDDTGRDMLARLVHGTTTMVATGLPAVLLGGLIGTLLGAIAGLRGGVVDMLVLRLIELFLCFPLLLFLLFAAAFLGQSRFGLIAVMAAVFWTSFARIVRGEMLSLRERDWVLVARGLGVGQWRIVFRHLLPQLWSHIGVTAAFCMAAAIVAESTLAFLGIGPSGTRSAWGAMLRQGSERAALGGVHLWLFPALAIVSVVACCHLIADRLRQASERD